MMVLMSQIPNRYHFRGQHEHENVLRVIHRHWFIIFIWLFSFLLWIDYYFDVWIITNERIVNIDQKGLFARHMSELNFGSVQDVTTVVTGILPTVLNYGDVVVQTAGEKERFVFRMIPDPYIIKDSIMKLSKNALDDDLRKVAGTLRAHTSV